MQAGDIVAAIDLGTSRTAYAYTVVGREHIWLGVPDSPDDDRNVERKTLTAVLMQRCDEDEAEGGWRVAGFGDTAEEDYLTAKADEAEEDRGSLVLFKFFKMELYQGGREQRARMDVDEPTAKAVGGEVLPMIFVVSKAIEYIKNQILDRVSMIAQEDDARLMWVVTVPAIWSNFGKRFMRAASHRAGLIADENDMQGLKLCLEPEAACLAVESSNQGVGSWHPGDKIMVLDCGGGTIDITSHLVESSDPLQLSELAEPCGGAWGSSIVDTRFKAFLQACEEFFDNASGGMTRLEGTHELFAVTVEWERQKTRLARGASLRVSIGDIADLLELSPREIEELRKLHNDPKPKELHVGGTRRNLVLPPALVESFFRGAITAIKDEVATQLSTPDLHDLCYIYMVGGFCASPLLQDAIREEFDDPGRDLKVVVAPRPGLAVVTGAALFGARGTGAFVSRKARLTYGVRGSRRFDHNDPEHVCREEQAVVLGDGSRVLHYFRPVVEKGGDVPVGHVVEKPLVPMHEAQVFVGLHLLVTRQEAVLYLKDMGVLVQEIASVRVPVDHAVPLRERGVEVRMEFGGTEIAVSCYKQHDGDKLLDAKVDFLEDFDPGALEGDVDGDDHRNTNGVYDGEDEPNPSPYSR
ncbi:unnamed protein product [Ectocarpus sp. CCAP 1310/34]|nr:unnamed protein product [Ectocarpus sp. CCAP 1310/34]